VSKTLMRMSLKCNILNTSHLCFVASSEKKVMRVPTATLYYIH
jgi:hypothetical protein